MKYLWVAMIGIACQEQQFHSIKDSNNGATPKIDVDPLSLNFGILSINAGIFKQFKTSLIENTSVAATLGDSKNASFNLNLSCPKVNTVSHVNTSLDTWG